MKLQDAQDKATQGPLRVFDSMKIDDLQVDGDFGEHWRLTSRRIAAGEHTLVAECSGTTKLKFGHDHPSQSEALHNAALLVHWANHGPKLLEALTGMIMVHGAGKDGTEGRINKQAIDAVEAAGEVEV